MIGLLSKYFLNILVNSDELSLLKDGITGRFASFLWFVRKQQFWHELVSNPVLSVVLIFPQSHG